MRTRILAACRPSTSDAVLARRAAGGDDDAFETLYLRYQPRLEAYCRSIVRHDEDARDAVQNAMTKALVALRRDGSPANVQGWLFRIAHNDAISLIRRRRPTTELVDVMHDARPGPAGDLLLREELRATLDNVRALPHNLQHPLLLRELAGLSYLQVADVVGGTPAAARKAVFDARTALSADRAGRDEACSVIRQSLSEGDGRRRRARVVRSHLQSCQSCCAWESEQRQRRQHLAALLPAASVAGTAGGWVAGLFGGGSTVVAGVTGSVATNAKIAASLAVIAAGTVPVVEHVEHSKPAKKVAASVATTRSTASVASRSTQRAAVAGTGTRAAGRGAGAGARSVRAAGAGSGARRAAARDAAGDSARRRPARARDRSTTDAETSAGRGDPRTRAGADGRRAVGGSGRPPARVAGTGERARASAGTGVARTGAAAQPPRDRPATAIADAALSAQSRPRDGSGARRPSQPAPARRPGAGPRPAGPAPGAADAG